MRALSKMDFPEGAQSLYVDGKRYTKESFKQATNSFRQRDAKGRFIKRKETQW